MNESEHVFGGGWTQLKLDVLRGYLSAYTKALKNKNFRLVYIDAFAGSGAVTPKLQPQAPIDGSARIALDTPGFDAYCFIETDKRRVESLQALREQHPARANIEIFRDDANTVLSTYLPSLNDPRCRAVLFLDPYGLSVDWSTLTRIAATKTIDLWYLFPLSGIYRQAARDLRAVDPGKAAALDRVLGTREWETSFYAFPLIADMFGDDFKQRHASVSQIEAFVHSRLKDIFPSVLKPLRLPPQGRAPLFSLFFAVTNDNPKAIGLANRIASHLLTR